MLNLRPSYAAWATLLLAGASVSAQAGPTVFPTARPEDVGMSSEKLRASMDLVRGWIERGRITGAIVLVIRDGKLVLHEAAGWADRERQIPMRTDHIVSM